MAQAPPKQRVFVSHNSKDKPDARRLAAILVTAGADVWFDEWQIRAGDSITGAVDEALQNYDIFLLVWSANAKGSNWVKAEMQAAIAKMIDEQKTRVVPLLLDDTPRPSLLRSQRYVDLRSHKNVLHAASEILGRDTQQAFIAAMQDVIEGLEMLHFPGYGPAIGCPGCGAGTSELVQIVERNEQYGGVKCTRCNWSHTDELY